MTELSSKELTALEDQIGMEKTLIKKYQAIASMVTDTEIRQCMESISQKHQQHCNTLMTFLQ